MNKKLLAVAIAGVLAAPGVALAQSSVTISGLLKGGFENSSLGNSSKSPKSQSGVVDDSSRVVFNVVEDLGGGLQAIGQFDLRMKLDDTRNTGFSGTNLPDNTNGNMASGNTHVGLRSKAWGRIFFGRQDLHYFNRESDLTVKGSLRADSISLLAFAGAGAGAITTVSRSLNVVHYTTPNWGGFTGIIAYSANQAGQESDVNTGVRRGRAWNVHPNFQGRNFQIGYSYWTSKADGSITTTCPAATLTVVNSVTTGVCGAGGVTTGAVPATAPDQRSDRLYGSYNWGGFKIGVAWDKSKLKNATTGAETSRRTAWSLPMSYTWGPHEIHGHYTKARDDKVTIAQDGAKMWALSYAYSLSKRTSFALTYASIKNDDAAVYNFFTGTSLGISPTTSAGEDPRLWGFTLRHVF